MKNIPDCSPSKDLPGSHRKVMALLVILVLFLLNAAWKLPVSSASVEPAKIVATHTLVPTVSNLVNTPSLEEMQSNHTQTDGIAIFGAIIVLVIFAGTFFVLRRKS